MSDASESSGFLRSVGESIGGFLSAIPDAINSLVSGIGVGAGVHGFFDWVCLVFGIALLLSVYRGVKRGRFVGPIVRGFIGVVLMGWAVS